VLLQLSIKHMLIEYTCNTYFDRWNTLIKKFFLKLLDFIFMETLHHCMKHSVIAQIYFTYCMQLILYDDCTLNNGYR